MNSNNSTRQKAIEWWNGLKGIDQVHYFEEYEKNSYTIANSPNELTGREIQNIWAIKINSTDQSGEAMKEESHVDNSKEGFTEWYFNGIDEDNAVVSDDRGFILEAPDVETGRELVKRWNENTSLKERIKVLEDALKGMVKASPYYMGLFPDIGPLHPIKKALDNAKEALNQK